MTIDPVTMARFLVMPGAPELLDAFSRIPEGPLRQATVLQVQAMADTYSGAPAEMRMADPLLTAAQAEAPPPAPALEPPRRRGEPKNLEERVIDLRMRGKTPRAIAAELAAPIEDVRLIVQRARSGGLHFPIFVAAETSKPKTFPLTVEELTRAGATHIERAARRHGKTLAQWMEARAKLVEMRRAGRAMPHIAEATGFPEKILWRFLYAARAAGLDLPLRSREEDAEFTEAPAVSPQGASYPPPLESLTPTGQATVQRSAQAAGLTVAAYQERQRQIIAARMAGEQPKEIAKRFGLTRMQVQKLLVRATAHGVRFPATGVGRPSYNPAPAPADDDGEAVWEANPFQPPKGVGFTVLMAHQRVFPELTPKTRGWQPMADAAARRGLTVEAYSQLRESIVRHRLAGTGPKQIAAMTGEGDVFVRDVLGDAAALGVVFPPVSRELQVA